MNKKRVSNEDEIEKISEEDTNSTSTFDNICLSIDTEFYSVICVEFN